MKFKPGDEVSFVNEKGGGKVISITKNGSYKVALEDGFDLTLTEKELALVKSAPDLAAQIHNEVLSEPLKKENQERKINTPANEITFFMVPSEENRVLSGEVAFYLSNQTDFTGYFVLTYLKEGNHFLIADDKIEPGFELELNSFLRQDLIDWEKIHIQILLFNKAAFKYVRPVQRDIQVLLPDIQISSKDKGRFAFARQVSVFRFFENDFIDVNELREKFSIDPESARGSNKELPKRKPNDSRNDALYGIHRNDKEVDLHIECLVKDISQVDQPEMLNIQLKCFKKEMDYAILNHYHSITFIHGVGEGVLKKALINELEFYSGVNWRNGSFEKYGAGAIEVLLK